MQPLQKTIYIPDPSKDAELADYISRHFDIPLEAAYDQIAETRQDPVYMNDTYQVAVHGHGECIHLSIKRIDRKPIHDWRDLQDIKNQLAGPEAAAVELYPAESRIVDTANQYHLWVIKSTTYLPFGFFPPGPMKDATNVAGTENRPFKET